MDVDVPENVAVGSGEQNEGGTNVVDVSATDVIVVDDNPEDLVTVETVVKRGRGRPKKNAAAPGAAPAKASPAKARAVGRPIASAKKVSAMTSSCVLSESVFATMAYPAKKAYLESLRQKRWEEPLAPERFARPLTIMTSQTTYSIGQHLVTGQENFEQLAFDMAKAALVNPYPHWTCPRSSVELVGDEHWSKFETGESATKIAFTEIQPEKKAASADSSNLTVPVTIPRHSGYSHNTKKTDSFLNAGGPVNDLAWCPLPWGPFEAKSRLPAPEFMHSFLAISTLKNKEAQDIVGDYAGRDNTIQLWDLGSITNNTKSGAASAPFLSVSFVHQCARVLHMTWCPLPSAQPRQQADLYPTRLKAEHPHASASSSHGGSNQDALDTSNAIGIVTEDEGEEAFPRLGLLAVAFAHGVVAIFSIPHPHALHLHYHQDAYSQTPLLIDLKPRVTLTAPGRSQICRLAWSHHGRAERLAAGTTDGRVIVWELPENPDLELHPQMNISPIELTKDDPQFVSAESGSDAPPATSSASNRNSMDTDANPTGKNTTTAPTRDELLLGLAESDKEPLRLYEVNSNYMPIFYRQVSTFMISGLAWHPKEENLLGISSLTICSWVWDIRYSNVPASQAISHGAMGSDLVFAGREVDYSYMMAMDDGTCRLITPPTSRYHDIHIAPTHTIDYSLLLRLKVSAGLDGLVHVSSLVDSRSTKGYFLFTAKDPLGLWIDRISKIEPPQAPEAAGEHDRSNAEDVVYFSVSNTHCANTYSPSLGTEEKGSGRPKAGEERPAKEEKKKSTLRRNKTVPSAEVESLKRPLYPDEDVFINRVRWCPNPRTPSWIAYGTRSGLVRVQLLAWTSPPDL